MQGTLGSCAAWLHVGGVPQQQKMVRQECGVGVIEIDVSRDQYSFAAPPTKVEPLAEEQKLSIIDTLGISPESVLCTALLDNGPVWQVLQLTCADQVLAVDASRVRWPSCKSIGLIGAHPPGSDCDYEVRMLAPSSGMSEDPITGSLNAALAHWMYSEGRLEQPIKVAQGTKIKRHGRVSIRPDRAENRIWVGGDTHIVIDGTIML